MENATNKSSDVAQKVTVDIDLRQIKYEIRGKQREGRLVVAIFRADAAGRNISEAAWEVVEVTQPLGGWDMRSLRYGKILARTASTPQLKVVVYDLLGHKAGIVLSTLSTPDHIIIHVKCQTAAAVRT